MGAAQQHPGGGCQRQRKPRFPALAQAQGHPYHAGDQSRQARPSQNPQTGIEGQSQVDGFRSGPVVDIVAVHKHQKKFQDNRRSNPDQSSIQVLILLTPACLFLIIIHVP